jgi:hypothetical protein
MSLSIFLGIAAILGTIPFLAFGPDPLWKRAILAGVAFLAFLGVAIYRHFAEHRKRGQPTSLASSGKH